jgi:hypothetical protein
MSENPDMGHPDVVAEKKAVLRGESPLFCGPFKCLGDPKLKHWAPAQAYLRDNSKGKSRGKYRDSSPFGSAQGQNDKPKQTTATADPCGMTNKKTTATATATTNA